MLKRISITGPESTGKTKLAEQLAQMFKTRYVPEYSRVYLREHGLKYSLEDVESITRKQWETEQQIALETDEFLFCDTDFLVNKIWCEVVFGSCPNWIEEAFIQNTYDLYLLCAPDLPWKEDPMRENPDNRDELFNFYEEALQKAGFNYKVVTGLGKDRLENAITFVKQML